MQNTPLKTSDLHKKIKLQTLKIQNLKTFLSCLAWFVEKNNLGCKSRIKNVIDISNIL